MTRGCGNSTAVVKANRYLGGGFGRSAEAVEEIGGASGDSDSKRMGFESSILEWISADAEDAKKSARKQKR